MLCESDDPVQSSRFKWTTGCLLRFESNSSSRLPAAPPSRAATPPALRARAQGGARLLTSAASLGTDPSSAAAPDAAPGPPSAQTPKDPPASIAAAGG